MRMYKGPEPCPGCGLPGSENARFGAKELCSTCTNFLRIGKDLKASPESFARVRGAVHSPERLSITELVVNKKEKYASTDSPHYISDFGGRAVKGPGTSKDVLKAFTW